MPNEYLTYASSLSRWEWANAALALMASAASIRAIFSMDSQTSRTIRWGFVTLSTGLFGQGMAIIIPNTWVVGFDSLIFGGSLALFLGNKRHPPKLPEGVSQWLAIATMVFSWSLFFLTI